MLEAWFDSITDVSWDHPAVAITLAIATGLLFGSIMAAVILLPARIFAS